MAVVISDKYEVIGQLGQGGMGLVYKVRHTRLDTISALKVLPAYLMKEQDIVNRFNREARVMARLNHPNIVKVLDIEQDKAQNLYYFVMEYIDGETLGRHIRSTGSLPLPELLTISHQVADALNYAHCHTPPITHRDIKPANIMIEDRTSRVVVMDFGIAKELGDADSTRTGMMIGTFKYASPEQLRQEKLDGGADVYSLGMVMYEMYTGKQFFGGLDEQQVLRRVLFDTTENEPHFDQPPPAAFADLLTRAMAKARAQRYHSMGELLEAIKACQTFSVEEEETGTMLISQLGLRESATPPPAGDIDAQIRKLEEERERRRIQPFQTKAREAREHATREGAADWATPMFQQGLTSEAQGAKSLQSLDFAAAQQAFEAAIESFTRAGTEAHATAAKRQAEQAKASVAVAKEKAEHAGARDLARTRYAHGCELESQADALLAKNELQQAAQLYGEALRSFADAQAQARREQAKADAEKARIQAESAKVAAEEQRASQFVMRVFREATEQDQRASVAIQQEEFTQARELYLAATQTYERAQREALSEKQRLETMALLEQAREARRQSEEVHAREAGAPSFQQAVILHSEGDSHLQAKAYDQAKQAYLQARDRYEQATQEVVVERERKTIATVRQQLQQAQAQADQVGAKERAAAAYEEAQRVVAAGQESERQGQYSEARDHYTQATQRFQQLTRENAVLAARERADAARQKMTEIAQGTEPLQAWAKPSWSRAQERARQAEEAYRKQEYGRAADFYTQAAQAYTQARGDAEQEQLQQETRDAQQRAQSAKARAEQENAARYAAQLWQQGLEAYHQAEQQNRAKELAVAMQRYRSAAELLTSASETAQRERKKLEASETRQPASTTQPTIATLEAARLHTSTAPASEQEQPRQQMREAEPQGIVTRKQVQEADIVRPAAASASSSKERAAIAAREKVNAAYAEAKKAGGEELLPGQYIEAVSQLREAERLFGGGDFDDARGQFERIAVRWGQIRQDAEGARQKLATEARRARAHALRRQAGDVKGKHKRQIERALTNGDHLLQQKQYDQAQAAYDEALALLSTLLPGQHQIPPGVPNADGRSASVAQTGGAMARVLTTITGIARKLWGRPG
ncbi:MAG: hypothetical protein FJ147_13775 [Deltaproteobacteria bacterium]|nr:hypothetical protein [Deltaproteobacteria bacterium]